ncbi:hypothetical protein Dimus_039250 [Dionaea muscipula]
MKLCIFIDLFLGLPLNLTAFLMRKVFWRESLPVFDERRLVGSFCMKDVRDALWDIGENKSPGIDGFNALFFKRTWDFTGPLISAAVLHFFENPMMLKQANTTIIHLIPKIANPSRVKDFRPIACCTTIFKIISKMICKRLIPILPAIIDVSQSAFVGGRSIVDNVLLCQEILTGYDRKMISPRCLAKIDLHKAYDSVHWSFLEQMLGKLQFPAAFIRWVMVCVSSTYFTFAVNGGLTGFFRGARGLRQGDPLSPLLFVIVMEYLSRILRRASRSKMFKFHPKCKKLGIVSMCFADDLMIVAKADSASLTIIKNCLDHFGAISGLEANAGKSSIFFGGVDRGRQRDLAGILGFDIGEGVFKYLGVPLTAKKLQIKHYQPLIEKITARISSWTSRLLSMAGRLQLIKSILMSLQVYWSQIFLFPKGVVKEVERLCRAFFWSGSSFNRKTALVAWKDICHPKLCGGLGIKDLVDWNYATLCQILWDIESKKDRLWIKWVGEFYLKGVSVWEAPNGVGSWVWRSFLKVRNRILELPALSCGAPAFRCYCKRSMYSLLHGEIDRDQWWKLIWGTAMEPRASMLLWLVSRDRLRTRDRLRKIGLVVDEMCLLCGDDAESCRHLFFCCPFVSSVIVLVCRETRLAWHARRWEDCKEWLLRCGRGKSRKAMARRRLVGAVTRAVWWERNCRVFHQGFQDAADTAQRALQLFRFF